ncbi:winged helix DNA-binding domain-containing protein [Saccharomonospora sp. NPDC006951]
MLSIDRSQALAYRIAAHGLHRDTADPERLAVFDLGVQDVTKRDTARLALTARLPDPPPSLVDDERFTLAWSHRGAPHYHRSAGFLDLIPGLLPFDDTDAEIRMGWQRKEIAEAGRPAREVLVMAAKALRSVVGGPMTKGAASEEVTRRIPAGFSRWCRGCQATHIHEQLMRLATPLAGIALEPGVSPATLLPLRSRSRIPSTMDVAEAKLTVERYLRLHGPATAADAAGFIGTSRAKVLEALWPEDALIEVGVDGKRAFVPAGAVSTMENPPDPSPVRLLPPWDPFLQGRDREILVPDKAMRKELWKILGNPGAILADGEVSGTWRAKAAGKSLEVSATAFLPLTKKARAAVGDEAARVAEARGYTGSRVSWA